MRHTAITPVAYQPPDGKAVEVEVTRVSTMVARGGTQLFDRVQRPEFNFLLVVTEGHGSHMLDFADHDLSPGSVLWVRPGQVQRWGDTMAYDAWVLIFPAGLLSSSTALLTEAGSAGGPCSWSPGDADAADAAALVGLLAGVADDESTPRELRAPTLTHLLSGLLLRLTAQARTRPGSPTGSEPWLAFRDLVDQEHVRHHDVGWYAERLGWSTRTLARAARTATGKSPKELIDERVLLEARRLLAHTALSVARVGESTGFEDSSNFGAWFKLRTGQTPSQFRRRSQTI